MRRSSHLVVAGWLLLVATQVAQAQPAIDPASTIAVSEEITRRMAAKEVEAILTGIVEATKSPAVADALRAPLQGLDSLGNSQYSERVYVRDYGRTTRDIIYKINFDNNILYVRYFFSVDKGEWRLLHFYFQTENSLPFPKEWIHIYPG
jgi:hypothetical protein